MAFSADLIHALADTPILVVGDVMVDAYMWGAADRISPEAPVPVVEVTKEEKRLGGAGNVALNIKAMGGQPILCSVIGNDAGGDALLELMQAAGLSTKGIIRSKERKTAIKTRIISRSQQLLRIDQEDKHVLNGEDAAAIAQAIQQLMADMQPRAILLQDYNKGVLHEPLIKQIMADANAGNIPVAVDPKKDNFLAYGGATLFKPNMKELQEGLHLPTAPVEDISLSAAVTRLREQMPHLLTFVTRSAKGVWLTDGKQTWSHPSRVRAVSDVSGAGDTVIAVATLLLANQTTPSEMAAIANIAGGLVCEEVGVVPVDREKLIAAISQL